MAVIEITREAQLRTRLRWLGYELPRSPVQDRAHPAYGGYMIADATHCCGRIRSIRLPPSILMGSPTG